MRPPRGVTPMGPWRLDGDESTLKPVNFNGQRDVPRRCQGLCFAKTIEVIDAKGSLHGGESVPQFPGTNQ